MASRDVLRIIRAARAGDADAQLALGRHYLFGGEGLPQNMPTALHWLDRAARQQKAEAWMLIGSHIPFETARQVADVAQVLLWYEKAFEAGVMQAALSLARLVQTHERALDEAWLDKATRMLQQAAKAGIADAQWLLAQRHEGKPPASGKTAVAAPLEWAASAAESGVLAARYALAEHAWAAADYAAFLRWSLPLARELIARDASASR